MSKNSLIMTNFNSQKVACCNADMCTEPTQVGKLTSNGVNLINFKNTGLSSFVVAFILSMFALIGITQDAAAQCGRNNIYWSHLYPICSNRTTQQGAGTFSYMRVYNTGSYVFETTSSPFDTQLSIYRYPSGAYQAYDDDGGAGTLSKVTIQADNGSWVFLELDRYNCTTCNYSYSYSCNGIYGCGSYSGGGNNCPSYGSATLSYKQVKNFTNTTSTSNMCIGTRPLTVSGAGTGGSWSIVSGGGSISGSTYTATSAGTKTIRYTVGHCYEDRSFTVTPDPTISLTATSSTTICNGGSVNLSVSSSGGLSCSYQWQVSSDVLGRQ